MFCLFFWLYRVACGVLVPQPGIEPRPLAVKAWSSTYWTTSGFPIFNVFIITVLISRWKSLNILSLYLHLHNPPWLSPLSKRKIYNKLLSKVTSFLVLWTHVDLQWSIFHSILNFPSLTIFPIIYHILTSSIPLSNHKPLILWFLFFPLKGYKKGRKKL